jgi:hypothetical protein
VMADTGSNHRWGCGRLLPIALTLNFPSVRRQQCNNVPEVVPELLWHSVCDPWAFTGPCLNAAQQPKPCSGGKEGGRKGGGSDNYADDSPAGLEVWGLSVPRLK